MQLHRRMIGREVQCAKVVALGFRFRTKGNGEAQLAEDVADLVYDERDWMQRTLPAATGRHGRIERGDPRGRRLRRRKCIKGFLDGVLQFIERLARNFLVAVLLHLGDRALQLREARVFQRVQLTLDGIETRGGISGGHERQHFRSEPVDQCVVFSELHRRSRERRSEAKSDVGSRLGTIGEGPTSDGRRPPNST